MEKPTAWSQSSAIIVPSAAAAAARALAFEHLAQSPQSQTTAASFFQTCQKPADVYTVSSTSQGNIVDGVNLNEMRQFAKRFKIRRLSLGLTQSQVVEALNNVEGPSYSQSAICRFEKLDVTPKFAQNIKPVLERWMAMTEDQYRDSALCRDMDDSLLDSIELEPAKKRRRRMTFAPQALEVLNDYFDKNTHPPASEYTRLAEELNIDRDVVKLWFIHKRSDLKSTLKKLQS